MAAGRNRHQDDLVKIYDKLCYRYSRYEVWQDMVWMFAISISNSLDQAHYAAREERYLATAKKYGAEELRLMAEMFAAITDGMEQQPDCDFLGELYMALGLGNSKAGQFFTPYNLCEATAEMTIGKDSLADEIEQKGYITVNDCACGAGAMLVAAASALKKRGINYQQRAFFVGQDIDATVALMCYIQLSLLGCAGYVHIGDTLAEPGTGDVLFGDQGANTWYTPMWYNWVWQGRMIARAMDRMHSRMPKPKPAKVSAPTTEGASGQIMFDFGGAAR